MTDEVFITNGLREGTEMEVKGPIKVLQIYRK